MYVFWFRPHYPARGRKRLHPREHNRDHPVQTSLPRKGTETGSISYLKKDTSVQTSLPRKGTETRCLTWHIHLPKVQTSLPRKGTETIDCSPGGNRYRVFRPHYPARGRKQCSRTNTAHTVTFRPHYPARGRKPRLQLQPPKKLLRFRPHYPARGRKLSFNLQKAAERQ